MDVTVGKDRDIEYPEGVQDGDRPSAGGTEADNGGANAAAVFAGRAHQLQRLQNGAVTGELVVLVEDMHEGTLGRPIVHCLPRDKGQPAVYCKLSDRLVLHAMWPTP